MSSVGYLDPTFCKVPAKEIPPSWGLGRDPRRSSSSAEKNLHLCLYNTAQNCFTVGLDEFIVQHPDKERQGLHMRELLIATFLDAQISLIGDLLSRRPLNWIRLALELKAIFGLDVQFHS